MSVAQGVAIIAGAGPGTGAAIARAFARKGLAVALLARTPAKLKEVEDSLKAENLTSVASFPVDLHQTSALPAVFSAIKQKFPGPLKVAVLNPTSRWVVKPFLELEENDWNEIVNGRINMGFAFSQLAIKELEKGGGGTLIFTGATAALRGSPKFALFAAASFGLRALSQSLAREFQPKGIHVAHAIIDGIIDTERMKSAFPESTASAENGQRLDPDEIGKAYVYLHEQAPSAWTQELDLRPKNEKW